MSCGEGFGCSDEDLFEKCEFDLLTRKALGLSMGAASHALGTSAAMDRDQFVGAYASLGLTLNGILTALLTPTVIEIINTF